MRRANSEQSGKRVWLRRMIASAVVATLLVSLLSFTVFAQNRYVITDGDLVTAHICFGEFLKSALRCQILIEGRYYPYSKWLFKSWAKRIPTPRPIPTASARSTFNGCSASP